MISNSRIYNVDLLKSLALILVILAHVEAPVLLQQIRGFDVCLLVILSGFLSSLGGGRLKHNALGEYTLKRFKRLILPSWIFIAFFFIIQSIFYKIPSINELFLTFTFQRDCGLLGYLWIIWVFFLCACLTPLMARIKINRLSILIYVFVILLNEILIQYTNLEENRLLYCSIFTIVPYGFMIFLGYNLDTINLNRSIVVAGFFCLIATLIAFLQTNQIPLIIEYKYPARIYYVSYGIFISLILWRLTQKIQRPFFCSIVKYIASNTLWIYFWHIVILYMLQFLFPSLVWWLQFLIVLLSSLFITYFQSLLVDRFTHIMPCLRYLKG